MRVNSASRGALFLATILGCFWPLVGKSHPAYLTAAQVTVEADGEFHAAIRFDTLAYALNDTSTRIGNEPMEALLSGPREELEIQLAGARDRLRRGVHVVTDVGEGTVMQVDFPDAARVLAWRDTARPVLPVVIPARFSGRLPPGARTVAWRLPAVLEQVILTVERPDEEPFAEAVEAGATSTTLPLKLSTAAAGGEKPSAQPQSVTNRVGPSNGSPWGDPLAHRRIVGSVILLFFLGLLGFLGWRRTK